MEENRGNSKAISLETSETNLEEKLYESIVHYNEKGECLQLKKILKLIEQLNNERKISRDILYMTLLSNTDTYLVKELITCDKSHFKLFEYPNSFYDLVVYKKKQWFELSIENDDLNILFDGNILKIINILKLVHHTNKNLKLNQVEISNFEEWNYFWKSYFSGIKYLWDVIEYCTSIESNIDLNQIFTYSSQHACLQILFNHLQCENFKYEGIISILKQEDELYGSTKQIDTILAYSIIMTIFKTIKDINLLTNLNNLIQNLKEKILSINDKKIIIKLFENIFSILFITKDNFTNNKENNSFICREPEIRLILILLKDLLDEMKLKNIFSIHSNEYTDFLNIQKYVANALWRVDLISNVKSPQKCERKLLKYMLAMPESLIQMSLKEGDYERAYQVVQVIFIYHKIS